MSGSSRNTRSYDAESGMNRTKGKGRKQRRQPSPPPPPPDSESDQFTESEAEEIAQAVVRDDTRRKRTTAPVRSTARGKPEQRKENNLEASHEEVESTKKPVITTASHFAFLLAIGRNSVESPISHPEPSTYIPDCGNMFIVIHHMIDAIGENSRLFEICPDYNSISFNLYYCFVYYYQILRARDDIGLLTRLERRSLKIFDSIGKPESWPIATPLIGFIQALGSCESPDKMYSYVSPRFPDFSNFAKDKSLSGLHNIDGIARAPIVPAQQELLRRFGADQLIYDDSKHTYAPAKTPLSTTDTFMGLTASTATSSDFQTLAFNQAWDTPFETTEPIGNYTIGQRQARIRRWNIPTYDDKEDFTQLEAFLFGDGSQVHWIRQLQRISSHVNKFFPGSTNLGAIPPTTTMENFTKVTFRIKAAAHYRAPKTDHWVASRNNWIMTSKAKYFGDTSTPLVVASKSTATNSDFDISVAPTIVSGAFSPERRGPYYVNDASHGTSIPLDQSEGIDQQDPTVRISEIINSTMYNNRGDE
jgi:hypothetical protein